MPKLNHYKIGNEKGMGSQGMCTSGKNNGGRVLQHMISSMADEFEKVVEIDVHRLWKSNHKTCFDDIYSN